MTPWAGHIALAALGGLLAAPGAQAQFDRPWRVYVVPFSHTDVGYTGPVPDVLARHHRTLDSALVYLDRTQVNSPGERFKWTIEVGWALPSYIESRSADQVERLMARVRAGDIEIGALHAGLQTDLMSAEELTRALYYAQTLRETYGVPVRTALVNDTPGATWALAQLLPESGVPYLSLAMNSVGSEFYETTDLPNLFYWEAQSGDRTLVWRSMHEEWAYLEGHAWGLYAASYAQTEAGLTSLLEGLQGAGYPYDAVLINAATGDNGVPNLQVVENARQWNARHADARVHISTPSEFFDYVATTYGGQIPTVRGDAPNWWSWALASSSTGGALRSRAAQDLLPIAETFAAVASAVAPGFAPRVEALQEAYVQNLLFEEHTFGSLTPAEDAPFWALKTGRVESAIQTATAVLDDALEAWGAQIATGSDAGLAAFNPSAWARTEVVTFSLDDPHVPAAFRLEDAETGEGVPYQVLSSGDAAFLADDVPALGHRAYRLVPTSGTRPAPQPLGGTTLENDHYRVVLDGATGSIASLFDHGLGQELTAPGTRFNQYLYNSSATPAGMQVVRSDSGAVLQRLRMRGAAAGTNGYETEVVLYDGVPRVDLLNRYDKRPPTSFEGVDFRFDFGLAGPQLHSQIPFGAVRLYEDELSGFRSGHYAAERWLHVGAGSSGPGVTLATRGPAVHAHGAGTSEGDVRLVASFNTSGTGYRAGVGPLDAAFSLTSGGGDLEPDRADRFAQEFSRPLRVRRLSPGQSGPLAATFSLLSVDGTPLAATTLKRPERGEGFVLRLYNPLDEPVTAWLASGVPVRAAFAVTPLEADGTPLSTDGRSVTLTFGPHEIRTLRLDLAALTDLEGSASGAVSLRLEPNVPNPFAAGTTIRFHLDGPAHVRLVVHDVLGREVAVLAEGPAAAGTHGVEWGGADSRPVASGLYVYTLTAAVPGQPIARQSRRMAVIR